MVIASILQMHTETQSAYSSDLRFEPKAICHQSPGAPTFHYTAALELCRRQQDKVGPKPTGPSSLPAHALTGSVAWLIIRCGHHSALQ